MIRSTLVVLVVSGTAAAGTVTGRVSQDHVRVAEYGVSVDLAEPIEVSAADGRFAIPDVDAGHHRLTVVGWAFVNQTLDVTVPQTGTIDVGTIAVAQGHHVDGTVVDGDGAPVGDATILAFSAEFPPYGEPLALMLADARTTTTNANGHFVIDGIPEDRREWRISAIAGDQRSIEQVLQLRGSIELTVAREGTIRGIVTNPKKLVSPVVAAAPVGNEGKRLIGGVNPLGQFELRVPAGVYDLTLDDERIAPLQVVVVANRVSVAKLTAPVAHVDLVVTAPDCILVRIFGMRPDDRDHIARAELGMEVCEADQVRFAALPPGPYRICVDSDDDHCTAVTLKPSPRIRTVHVARIEH